MKIIDLLNKIANGEVDYEQKIKISNEIIDVDELLGSYIFDEKRLNDTIEIIGEEGKKIPEKFKINYEIDEENTINMEKATMLECDLACRINEIIDYLKEKENK